MNLYFYFVLCLLIKIKIIVGTSQSTESTFKNNNNCSVERECLTNCSSFGYENCNSCHCKPSVICPSVKCTIVCEFGRMMRKDGCEYCRCQEPCMHSKFKLNCSTYNYCRAKYVCNTNKCNIKSECLNLYDSFEDSNSKSTSKTTVPNSFAMIPPSVIPGNAGPENKLPDSDSEETNTNDKQLYNEFFETTTIIYFTTNANFLTDNPTDNSGGKFSESTFKVSAGIYASLAAILTTCLIGIISLSVIVYKQTQLVKKQPEKPPVLSVNDNYDISEMESANI